VDPLAGSYYVESLTDRIEKEALQYIKRIDDLGGAVKAIEQGYIQQEIQDSAYAWQMDVEKNERIIVGLNKFQVKENPPKGLLRVDPAVGEHQRQKLASLKANRNQNNVDSALASLRKAASGADNLMPPILEAVRAYATLGEICGVLREEFGEYKPNVMF
jgi:methylmalonyl-CoA mutase N-terminal domain/subunit